MSQSLTESENIAVGVIAAFIEGVILQPTLYWKNARAQKLKFTLDPRIIYRGTSASIFNECQMMGLQFGVTGFFQKIFGATNGSKLSTQQEFASAMLGGAFTAFFASPVELVMIQQQLHGGNFVQTPIKVAKQYGFLHKGLMRGLMANICRDSIYVTGMLGVTPIVQNYLIKEHELSTQVAGFYASMVGGLIGAIPSHPFDIIKTCMQGDLEQKKYSTFTKTFQTLWNNEGGFKRMFFGCMWRSINILGTVYVANECRVRLPSLLFDKDTVV